MVSVLARQPTDLMDSLTLLPDQMRMEQQFWSPEPRPTNLKIKLCYIYTLLVTRSCDMSHTWITDPSGSLYGVTSLSICSYQNSKCMCVRARVCVCVCVRVCVCVCARACMRRLVSSPDYIHTSPCNLHPSEAAVLRDRLSPSLF